MANVPACPISDSLHSGLSLSLCSGSGCSFIELNLPLIRLAKTDHADSVLNFDKDQGIKPVFDVSKRTIPCFTVVTTIVNQIQGRYKVEFDDPVKRQRTFNDIALIFDRIIFDLIRFIVCTIRSFVKRLLLCTLGLNYAF